MDQENNDNIESKEKTETKPENSTLRGIMIALVICCILSVVGAGFGIYGTIQANKALAELEPTSEEETDEESVYGKPSEISDIEYVFIAYNNSQDRIDIINDPEEGIIDYYTFDSEDEYYGESIDTNVSGIMQYIIDNDLEYLGDNEALDEETWSIEVTSEKGSSYASGNGETPDWFNALLEELNVDNNGYQSKKLSK